jgi:hypothetical protein
MGQRLCFSSALQGEMDSIDLDKDFSSSGSYPNNTYISIYFTAMKYWQVHHTWLYYNDILN